MRRDFFFTLQGCEVVRAVEAASGGGGRRQLLAAVAAGGEARVKLENRETVLF
jgi:hypothetical protein